MVMAHAEFVTLNIEGAMGRWEMHHEGKRSPEEGS
jgi:hypothetical protein